MIDYLNGEGGFLPVTQDSFEELITITRDYEAELAQMAAEAGVDLDLVSQGVDQVKDEFELLGMENADVIYLMYNELNAILDLRNAIRRLNSVSILSSLNISIFVMQLFKLLQKFKLLFKNNKRQPLLINRPPQLIRR